MTKRKSKQKLRNTQSASSRINVPLPTMGYQGTSGVSANTGELDSSADPKLEKKGLLNLLSISSFTIILTLGLDMMNKNEFIIARICLWLCLFIMLGRICLFVFTFCCSLWQKAFYFAGASFVLIIIALFISKWIDTKNVVPARSYPSVSMVIDAVDNDGAHFHFLFVCNGPREINILRIIYHNDSITYRTEI